MISHLGVLSTEDNSSEYDITHDHLSGTYEKCFVLQIIDDRLSTLCRSERKVKYPGHFHLEDKELKVRSHALTLLYLFGILSKSEALSLLSECPCKLRYTEMSLLSGDFRRR
jgi:hypothetical protein